MLGEAGSAARFTAAIKAGSIAIRDATCPAIHAGLQAAEKGIPFMPLRGILGSDLIGRRPDWRHHRQSLWQCRSRPAAAGAEARYRALPCPARRSRRQCLDRAAARAGHHGPCRPRDPRDGRADSRNRISSRARRARRGASPPSMSAPSPRRRRAPGRWASPSITRRMMFIWRPMPKRRAARERIPRLPRPACSCCMSIRASCPIAGRS